MDSASGHWRLAAVGFVALLVTAGCAATNQQTEPGPGQRSAERVAQMLAGSYAGVAARVDGENNNPDSLTRLEAGTERISTDGVAVRLEQRTGDGEPRNFRLIFRPTALATRLEGSFSPLGPQGTAVGECPLEVSVQSDGFVARTSPATCRFGQGRDAAALIKEIAHDGERLVIGDRVVDPQSGEPRLPERVLELRRVHRFVGWAGVRDGGGSWRVVEDIELESDGLESEPDDAGGMTLGLALELAPHQVRDDEPPVLRLRVFDTASGDLLGQAWADSAATRIGLGLSDVQVGLRRRDSR